MRSLSKSVCSPNRCLVLRVAYGWGWYLWLDVTGRKVEEDKDKLIESIEQKLTAKETLVEVFTIRWRIL